MLKHKVWQPVKREEVPNNATVITSTWAMKKKSNGVKHAKINRRGYEQVDDKHYGAASIASPVTNDVTIRIMMVLMLMAGWVSNISDVKGAFLLGNLEENERIYMEVPEGFESYYKKGSLLLLVKTLYGLKQAAIAFWKILLAAMKKMGFSRSSADPCLYYTWTATGLVVWLSWIDDCLCLGPPQAVNEAKMKFMKKFDATDEGEMKGNIGCKIICDMKEM